ncbi:hypothetical protein [Georgenia sp. SYP-B2076]|uniref:hypothetical protein n=1 Tax=Georgenia sp. SYP-B2076 TaxID=2495881 RepID=UPI000F8F4574|nr:hypothetical protein [Georgenia sp. SYP-B2076]
MVNLLPLGAPWGGKVLHLHDAAHTAENLVGSARRQGLPWSRIGLPWYYRHALPGPLGALVAKGRAPVWDAWLGARTLPANVVHVHTGTLGWHTRFFRRPYVLHLHGTDIRTASYESAWQAKMADGLARAAAVVYSSPDLAEHTRRFRDDAYYLPQPVDVASLPAWAPNARPRLVFASRWEAVKGADAQLEVARRVIAGAAAVGLDVDVVGIDWGPAASAAAAAGVRLVPKLAHEEFLGLLATAHMVVGQMSGILAVSELEALAIGVPVVGGHRHDWYGGLNALSGPAPGEVAEGALAALTDPAAAGVRLGGREWVLAEHDAAVGVRRLQGLYAEVAARR